VPDTKTLTEKELPSASSAQAADDAVFRRLADGLSQGVLVSRDFKPLYVNQAFAELFGYDTPAEIMAFDSIDPLLSDEAMQTLHRDREKMFRGEPISSGYVLRGRRRDGEHIWLQNRPVLIDWIDGPAVCTTMIDVTRQRDTEEALKASEESYRRMFENAPEGIFRTTLDFKLIDVNPALAEMVGFTEPDEMKKAVNDESFEFYVDRDDLKRLVDLLSTEGQVKDHDVQWRRLDGTPIWVSLSANLVRDGNDGSAFFEGTAVDVTDRFNATQSMLFAKNQAEMANRAKSEFLAHMSHELRTPLNCVIGFSQILMEEMFGPLGGENYRGYAKDINSAGNHLLRLISDILDISKIEAGELEPSESRVDVGGILVACMKMMRDRADEGGLVLSVEFDHDLPEIFADELRIKQIVLNLLSNAIKFTEPAGRVTASADLIEGGGMAISVKDTGIGIAAKDLERVLAPFEQIRDHHMVSQEGTGLGLFLTQALAHMHGGQLAIESTLGEGTQVTVTLPPGRVVTPAT
jgi:PAS domain S-box-containing protein